MQDQLGMLQAEFIQLKDTSVSKAYLHDTLQSALIAQSQHLGTVMQTAVQERESLYKHDIEIGNGASQWVVNARAMVRPAITYGLFILFCFVEVAGFYYALKMGTDFEVMMDQLWDDETQLIWSSVVAFWFGTQAFSKK